MKPGIKTTELLVTILTDVGVVASSLAGVLPARYAAFAAAAATVAYSISRGIAKTGVVVTVPAASVAPAPAQVQPPAGA